MCSLPLFSFITPEDYIDTGCSFVDEDILTNKNYSFRLDFNNRAYVKEILKKLGSQDRKDILQLDLNKPYKKKKLDASFKISNGESSCNYKATVKIVGDLQDHLRLSDDNSLDHSILVKLIDSNINGITSFRLFIPKSRLDNNEILGAFLYKKLGFLSPRTLKIQIDVNGILKKYIFQEEISKEFLERNNRQEGLLFEGVETFGIARSISFARVINSDIGELSKESASIALNALDKLNTIYFLSASSPDKPIDIFKTIDHNHQENHLKLLQSFYALSYILNGEHGLSKDDSRFYFNNVYGNFEPIYYDGLLKIQENLTFKNIDKDTMDGINTIKKKLDAVNYEVLYSELLSNGFSLRKSEFNKLINKIFSNIDFLKKLPVLEKNYIKLDNKKISKFFMSEIYFDSFINLDDKNHNEIRICNINFEDCYKDQLDFSDFKKVLSQSISFDGIKYSMYTGGFNKNSKVYPHSIYNWDFIKIDSSFLSYPKEANIEVDKIKKTINIDFLDATFESRVIFHGGSLKNWKIRVISPKNIKFANKSKFSINGLTGCLSFHDIKLSNIAIKIDSSYCEDAVHFLRAKGDIEKIVISNSEFDAIDIDFSSLKINSILVSNAGNDCLDVSSGKYEINDIHASGCLDKGISAGEKSDLQIQKINIDESLFGVVSKDSSFVKLVGGSISTRGACASKYRKKQEFGIGYLLMGDTKCLKNNKMFSANISSL